MATNEELARLIVSLEVTTTKYYNALRKAQQQTNNAASGIEKRLTGMSTRIDRTFANLGQRLSANLTGPLAGVGAAFSVREIVKYADTWTEAGNRVRASGEIIGVAGRSLEEIRQIADDSRAGFNETVQLYSRILRSAGDVASSEVQIAKATELVSKAFKSGGAAASEMNAGILQLSQGLGSGFLQGDELRSVRENAPVLAKVIADYFGVTVAGLKELGAEGKLQSTEVFKAILSGEKLISAAFNTTNRTISDSITLVENALIQYIGSADKSNGVTAQLTAGLSALADNFDTVADTAVALAAIIAGALVGRGIVGMIGALGAGISSLRTFTTALQTARAAGAGMGGILSAIGSGLGPLAILVGGAAALAFQQLSQNAADSASNIDKVRESLNGLNVSSGIAELELKEVVTQTEALAAAEERLAAARAKRALQDTSVGDPSTNFLDALNNRASSLQGFIDKLNRDRPGEGIFGYVVDQAEKDGAAAAKKLAEAILAGTAGTKDQIADSFQDLYENIASPEALEDLNTFYELYKRFADAQLAAKVFVDTSDLEKAREDVFSLGSAIETSLSHPGVSQELKEELKFISEGFDGTAESAEYVKQEIDKLAAANPDLAAWTPQILEAINNFLNLAAAAKLAREESAKIVGAGAYKATLKRDADAYVSGLEKRGKEAKATGAFLTEQNRQLSLTEQQLELEEEIARVRKEAEASAAVLTEEQIKQLATRRLAQKESFKDPKKTTLSDTEKFDNDLQNQRNLNESLLAEAELLKTLNPLARDYAQTIAAWKYEQELLNEAEKEGVELTPARVAAIKEVAAARAAGDAALAKTEEANQKLIDSTQEWLDLSKTAVRSFIDDLIEGKTAAEALGNVLQQLGSKLIDLGINSLFGTGTGGNFGIFSGLIPGRANGGSVKAGSPYIVGERRPELFVPNQDGMIIPRVGTSGGTNTSVPVQITIDATGADEGGLAKVQNELVRLRAELPGAIKEVVSKRPKKGW